MGSEVMKIVEERLRWFYRFMPLYEKAAPVLCQIANVDKLTAGELPVSPYTLASSNLTLRPILEAVKKLHEPKEKRVGYIQKEFEIALFSSIKVAEAAEKYVELRESGIEDRIALGTIISSTVLAHEYIESVSRKLEILKSQASNLEAMVEFLNEKKAPSKDVAPRAGPQLAIDKAADGIERGLDRLGNALTFPIEKIVRYAGRLKTANRKK